MSAFSIPIYKEWSSILTLNNQDEDCAPVEYHLPDPPNKRDIFGYNLPTSKQKFIRPNEAFASPTWNEKKFQRLSLQERVAFEEREVARRINGHFFYNNGKITYLTGANYFYCAWWSIDTGYPEFRDRDKRWWYFWDFCVKDDDCYGMAYPKHRREGATYRAGCANYDMVSRQEEVRGGIQSKTGKDAAKVFKIHIVRPWQKLPSFFRPLHSGSTAPVKILDFSEPSRKQTHRTGKIDIDTDTALNSSIDWEVSSEEAYDSQKLLFLHQDEVGKSLETNVYDRWKDYNKPCLHIGKKIIGKALFTSTVADMELKGGENFKKIWDESDYRKRDKNGRTASGLYRYFVPAWDGMEGFVDEFGMSDCKGAKEFLDNTREGYKSAGKLKSYLNEQRLNPYSSAEAFEPSSDDCSFNLVYINERIHACEHDGLEEKWVQGNLEWVKEVRADGSIKDRMTQVHFEHSENGRFWFRLPIEEHLRNKVERSYNGFYFPLNKDVFAIGIDPFDHYQVKDNNPSKGAIYAGRKWDPIIDPETKPQSEWVTNKILVRYCERPEGGPRVVYEDCVKLCFYLGTEVLIEKNKIGCYNYFYENGLEDFIANRPESAYGASASTQNPDEMGVDGSAMLKERMFEVTDAYIEKFYRLVDDKEILKDWKYAKIEKLTKFDRTVACSLMLLQFNKYIRPTYTPEVEVPFVKTYDNRGITSRRIFN